MLASLLTHIAIAISTLAPPSIHDPRSTLQRLQDAGISVFGRDPCAGSGLCCALLPVHTSDDVDRIRLPRSGFSLDHLRLIGRLPNVQSVGCERELTETEYRVLDLSVARHVWGPSKVRLDDGTVVRNTQSALRPGIDVVDTNNDGVVDENDDYLTGDPFDATPPRIKLSK